MSLGNLLSAEQIIPEMKATERWPAIVELIDLLVRLARIKPDDRDSIRTTGTASSPHSNSAKKR